MAIINILLYLSLLVVFFPLLLMMQSLDLFLPWLLTGLIGGLAAGVITGYRPGLPSEIGIGLAGYALGGAGYALATRNGVGGPLTLPSILVGIAGAVVVMALLRGLRSST